MSDSLSAFKVSLAAAVFPDNFPPYPWEAFLFFFTHNFMLCKSLHWVPLLLCWPKGNNFVSFTFIAVEYNEQTEKCIQNRYSASQIITKWKPVRWPLRSQVETCQHLEVLPFPFPATTLLCPRGSCSPDLCDNVLAFLYSSGYFCM